MKDTTSILRTLADQSSSFGNLSSHSLLHLVNELLECAQTKNWSTAGSWVREEVTLLGLMSKDSMSIAKQIGASKRQVFGQVAVTFLQTLKSSLLYQISIEEKKNVATPELLSKVSKYTSEEGVVQMHGPFDISLIPGHSFEIWTDPTVSEKLKKPKSQKDMTQESNGVCLVLGAGNQAFLTFADVLQCLFIHPRKPVLIKHHPLRPWLYEPFAMLLEPLIKRGFVDMILDGGIPHTKSLLDSQEISHVHLTGAFGTANAIKETLALTRQHLTHNEIDDMVTSELGCATPWIITPGSYTNEEMKNAATAIVTAKKGDSGCNCLSAQVLVLPEKWGQKEQFRQVLMQEFETTETDPCYYPGSSGRCTEIADYYKKLGDERVLEMTAKIAVEAGNCPNMHPCLVECGTFGKEGFDGLGLTKEAFGPIMSIVELPGGGDAKEYVLKTVAPFLNNKENIFGSLSCSLIIPGSIKNLESFQKAAIASLKYGTIAVNCWSVLGYVGMCQGALWCGHGREKRKQSGNGYVGNHFQIANAEKTVVYAPPLCKEPLIKKNNPPPAIVMDAMNEFTVAKTNIHAFVNILILLVIRIISSIVPIDKILGWSYSYGSSV